MTTQFDLQAIDRDLAASLSRSFLTALTLLRDSTEAETLVIKAVVPSLTVGFGVERSR